ncbi:hypothetical protein T190115A13A_20290 [Tenacibaculum sp. 190524A02b]|uniref:Uncharacterized protein n=1 Tax=Tenacibaculum vairaonense TaxID=3137860 RepID=A0ABM9PMS4_9FLAO
MRTEVSASVGETFFVEQKRQRVSGNVQLSEQSFQRPSRSVLFNF